MKSQRVMPIDIEIRFNEAIVNSTELGSSLDSEVMVSRVFFDLTARDGEILQRHPGLHADVKQVAGSSELDDRPLEVTAPDGYEGPFNQQSFHGAVAEYYSMLVSSTGVMVHLGGQAIFRGENVTMKLSHTAEFKADRRSAACGD